MMKTLQASIEVAPVAQLLRDAVCRKEWRVTLGDGRVYVAYTYPESALIYIENLDGRPVRGCNVEVDCRVAIANAAA